MRNAEHPTLDRPVAPEHTGRRYVYNGDSSAAAFEHVQRGNRPVRKRNRSPFTIVIMLFATSLVIVLYVWNKITVNRLAIDVGDLRAQYEKVLYANEILRAEINKKSSLERIGKLATGSLGLTSPKEQPIWFEVQFDQLQELKEN